MRLVLAYESIMLCHLTMLGIHVCTQGPIFLKLYSLQGLHVVANIR